MFSGCLVVGIDAPIEEVPAGRAAVHLHIGQFGLARAQRIDELHGFVDVHVLVVVRDVHEQRNAQIVDVKERRAVPVDLRPLGRPSAKAILRVDRAPLLFHALSGQAVKQVRHGHERRRRPERRRIS